MSESMLAEYVKVTRTIENIQFKLNKYIKDTEKYIETAKSEKEQNKKIKEIKKTLAKIKKDPEVTNKYRILKKRQIELKNQLLSTVKPSNDIHDSDIDKTISDLKIKYNILTQNEIVIINNKYINNDKYSNNNKYYIQNQDQHHNNMNFDIILHEIQNNILHRQ